MGTLVLEGAHLQRAHTSTEQDCISQSYRVLLIGRLAVFSRQQIFADEAYLARPGLG